jgi:hypothetical protein
MNGRNTKLGRLLSLAVAVSALAMGSCEDEGGDGDGGLLDKVGEQCGLKCPAKGIVDGNASISGYAAIDEFFASVVKFQTVSASVSAGIEAEIAHIQAGFRVTPAELSAAGGNLNTAIKAKVTAAVDGSVVLKAEPARCDIDAKASFEAKARCQASAGCEAKVTPPMVNVECSGSCEAEASVMASCTGGAMITCTVNDPSLTCTGQCSGECTVDAMVAAQCSGSCRGTCSAGCSATGDANGDGVVAAGECVGSCSGMCTGSCSLAGDVNAMCNGKCSGECTYTPPSAMCSANATVRCQAAANASVMCQGRCDGEVTPPMVDANCKAEASCEASAKADASLSVQCKPPSVDIAFRLKAGANATVVADVRNGLNTLKARWPGLSASLKKGQLVVRAGTSLTNDAQDAVMATVNALGGGDATVDAVAKFRIATCVPPQVPRVGEVITKASTRLNAQVAAVGELRTAVGMM